MGATARKEIKWANAKDSKIIKKIVSRAMEYGFSGDSLSLEMDISATHANGCPLRLKDLLQADKFSFFHDVLGIRNHINRKTGELTNFFWPRFAKRKGD